MKHAHPALLAALLLSTTGGAGALDAQAAARLGPEVRAFVSTDEPVVALTGVLVIDGTGRAPRPNQTVVLANGRFQAVGDAGRVTIPAGARVLDLAGHTVIPGLLGMHDHMFYTTPQGGSVQMPFSAPRLYLASGVTTIRTTGSFSTYAELNLKAGIERGEVPGPRMHITAPYIISPGPNAGLSAMGMQEVETEESRAPDGAILGRGGRHLDQGLYPAPPRHLQGGHRRGASPRAQGDRPSLLDQLHRSRRASASMPSSTATGPTPTTIGARSPTAVPAATSRRWPRST